MPNQPSWLVLRGLARETRHWGTFTQQLAQQLNSSVQAIDLPGAGKFRGIKSPTSISQITEFLRRHIARNSHPPLSILAVSMGAMVAMDWMSRYPHEIQRGVLINSSVGGLSPFYRRMRWQTYYKFLAALFTRDIYLREKKILSLISHRHNDRDQLAAQWAKIFHEAPMAGQNFLRQLLAAARFRPSHEVRIRQPILLMVSDCDQLVDPSCSLRLSQFLKTSLLHHPWAGHDLPLDDGEWVAREVKHWIMQSGK